MKLVFQFAASQLTRWRVCQCLRFGDGHLAWVSPAALVSGWGVSSVRGAWPWIRADMCTCVWTRGGAVYLGTHHVRLSPQARLAELPESQR